MNDFDSILRRLRLVLAAIAVLGLLVLPSAASAKRHHPVRDRNHDGLPDKWEKRFGISTTKRGMAKADPDKDGLNNTGEFNSGTNPKLADTNGNGVPDAAEDTDHDGVSNGNEIREHTNPRKADSNGNGVKDGSEDADHDKLSNAAEQQAGTDPMNPDSDGDGIKDGNEDAGEVVSFDGTTLTLHVYGGSTVSGTVDADTSIGCSNDNSGDGSTDTSSTDGTDTSVDDGSTDPSSAGKLRARQGADDTSDPSTDPAADDPTIDDGSTDTSSTDGTDTSVDDGSGNTTSGCSTADLKPGAVVTEASFSVTADGTFFDAIELK